jgi:hypothetical protein
MKIANALMLGVAVFAGYKIYEGFSTMKKKSNTPESNVIGYKEDGTPVATSPTPPVMPDLAISAANATGMDQTGLSNMVKNFSTENVGGSAISKIFVQK